jgi:hypothetical protein
MWEGAARATATCGSSRTARQFSRRWPQGVFLLRPIKPNHVAELPFPRDPPANTATGDLRCEWIHFQPFGGINRPSQPLHVNGARLFSE